MKDKKGRLVVVIQAAGSGAKAGPYRVEVHPGHRKSLKQKGAIAKSRAVLGSPCHFELLPGKYTVRVRNATEGEYLENTSVISGKETMAPVEVGTALARSYNDLLLEMEAVQERFEEFMLQLGNDASLQAEFQKRPDEVLQANKLLPKNGEISRKNRLFIGLLSNGKLRELIRKGYRDTEVPADFRKHHAPRLRRYIKKFALEGEDPSKELVESSVRRRYFFQETLSSILTDETTRATYNYAFSRAELNKLFEATYQFVDNVDPNVAAATAPAIGAGKAAVITYSILRINAAVGTSSKAAIFVDAGVVSKSYVFTKSYIISSTKIVCSVAPRLDGRVDIADDYDLFTEYSVSPKLAESFKLEQGQFNDIANFAEIADAIIDGVNIIDYKKALQYAEEQLRLAAQRP